MELMKEEILSIWYPTGEDMIRIKSQGISVDYDNEPAIEKIPISVQSNKKEMNGLLKKPRFVWYGIDHWAKEGHMNMGAKMSGLTNINFVSKIQMFLLLFLESGENWTGTN